MTAYKYTFIVLMAFCKLAQFCGKQHDMYEKNSYCFIKYLMCEAEMQKPYLEFLKIKKYFKSSFILQMRKQRLKKYKVKKP